MFLLWISSPDCELSCCRQAVHNVESHIGYNGQLDCCGQTVHNVGSRIGQFLILVRNSIMLNLSLALMVCWLVMDS